MQISIAQQLVPACNPFVDGCFSVSRAGRYGLANIVFRMALLPAAVLQALTWMMMSRWLIQLMAAPQNYAWRTSALPWLGITAAIFLILYGSFLGTEGAAYRWMRQFGIVFYFGCTMLAMLLTTDALRRYQSASRRLASRAVALLTAACVSVLALGLINVLVGPWLDAVNKDSLENITEWWAATLMMWVFVLLSFIWRQQQLKLDLSDAQRPK